MSFDRAVMTLNLRSEWRVGFLLYSSIILVSPKPPPRSAKFVSLLLGSPSRGPQMEALPPLDQASQQLCWASLTCLAHYLCWVPLSAVVRPHLLSTIFHYAAFGCQTRPDPGNQSGSPSSAARAGAFSSSTHKLGRSPWMSYAFGYLFLSPMLYLLIIPHWILVESRGWELINL